MLSTEVSYHPDVSPCTRRYLKDQEGELEAGEEPEVVDIEVEQDCKGRGKVHLGRAQHLQQLSNNDRILFLMSSVVRKAVFTFDVMSHRYSKRVFTEPFRAV